MNTNAFQECSAVDITTPVTKWSYCIKHIDELPYIIDKAFHIANDKKGAVLLIYQNVFLLKQKNHILL